MVHCRPVTENVVIAHRSVNRTGPVARPPCPTGRVSPRRTLGEVDQSVTRGYADSTNTERKHVHRVFHLSTKPGRGFDPEAFGRGAGLAAPVDAELAEDR